MKFKVAQGVLRKLFMNLTEATLQEKGYDIEDMDGYICVHRSEDEPDLLLYVVTRELSNKESTTIKAPGEAVEKLENKAKELAGNYISCIAYCVAKYSLNDLEICIIPTQIMRERACVGTEYSDRGDSLHYNYAKVSGELPYGAIMRKQWKSVG